ncbi:DUF4767 domain-containing protein [Lactobacillus sp. PV037]|uniref:DUF4767 domain-containing protein n=1 Tax=unclassified Lactobacillus TaxID=2620435 RepID=UPI00223EA24C|nr:MULTISPECIES: DUF4767 domain-containing protein [unclassified Lactobacillus]QNQ82408.1 DUF4767 domain-containing protein [Lactobacillus sp. PV012]QNQ83479.1 DUF4767 domain-containing protein [Lactobacillus sp. PV037]
MYKKLLLISLCSVGLFGCSNPKASSHTNSSSQPVTQAPKRASSLSKSNKKAEDMKVPSKKGVNWNQKKDKELAKFVKKWSQAASQSYRQYNGHDSIKTVGGVTYPEAFSSKKFSIENHDNISLGWSPDGKDKYEYNVVAIYNQNVNNMGWHNTYLFCLHKGKPVVLLDSTHNVAVIPLTINTDQTLNDGFQKIVQEK